MTKIIAVVVDFKSTIRFTGAETIIVDNNKFNRGFAKGANIGIKKALNQGATHILLINPDVKITRNALSKLAQNSASIVAPVLKFDRVDKTIIDYGGRVNWLLGRTTHNENRQGKIEYVSFACVLIKAEVFKKIGLLDEKFFMYFEDVDFCLRAKAVGFKIYVDQAVLVEHQISEHKYSQDQLKKGYLLDSNKYFIDKWISKPFQPLAKLYLLWLKNRP